ncbi:hypothetical protein QFC20_005779 [Naganishia adeliensis]|uniref:Uncharacterized protein n=1 Tax=Naganishia adeliensis TaxID=92952 RepID=A0ACC2VIA4_9TREE|nr:hypothetical protein QFC20_005779 [Naganishia adeliensis]
MSTQRGSAEHEQIFTPESIYTPLVAEHGDDPTQAALHRPRSPEIAPRDLGSQDSGQGDRGQHDVCLEETPRPKEELVTSATMVSTSTMSQHSSYQSFPSDAPLLSMIESSSADSMRPEQAETEETPRPPQPSARQRVLLAAQRFHMGLPSDYENKKRMWVPMPKSYLNYNPEDEDPPSTHASSTPRFTDIPIASGSGTQSETPPGPRTIHQALEPEPVSTAVANVPEQPERPASVGLGIGLPPDPAADTAEAGPSSTSEQYDPVKTPMDRLLAGKVKEKKADAGDYLRKQGKAALDLKDQFVASVSRRRQSVQRGFNGKRRRSIVISPPTPILEAKSERDTPRVSQTEVSQLPASAQQRPQTAGSTRSSYYVQKPDLPSSKSPHECPVIPTETLKEKKLYRRVFSKEFLGFRKDSSNKSEAPVAPESSTQGRARESYEEQERRLLEAAESMGRPVHSVLGRIEDSPKTADALETDARAAHADSDDEATSRKFGGTGSGDHSLVRGSAEAVRLGASTSSFSMTPSVSCEAPPTFEASSTQVHSTHVSSDPLKPAKCSPLVPSTEQQTRPSGNDAAYSSGRRNHIHPCGGPRDLEGERPGGNSTEPATEQSSPETLDSEEQRSRMSAAQARRAETRPQTAAETERPTFDKEAEEPGTPDLSRCETCGCDCARAARRAEKGKAKEE